MRYNFKFDEDAPKILLKFPSVRRSLERYLIEHKTTDGFHGDYLGEDGVMPYLNKHDIHSMPEPEKSLLFVGQTVWENAIRLEKSCHYHGEL